MQTQTVTEGLINICKKWDGDSGVVMWNAIYGDGYNQGNIEDF